MASALADLADHPEGTPSPTATLLVATDPTPPTGAPDESLILGAPLVTATAPPAVATPPALDDVEAVSWVDDVGTWGTPLLVGAVLLLALTGRSGLRRLARRRSEA